MKRFWHLMILLMPIVALTLGGCSKPPLEEIAAAEAAVQKARDAGAPEFAAKTFKAAENHLQKAYEQNDAKKYGLAKQEAITARELAEAALREAVKKKAAQDKAEKAASEARNKAGQFDQGVEETVGAESLTGRGVTSSALPNIYFDFDRYTIRVDQRKTMDKAIAWLLDHPKLRVRLEGNTDARGEAEYNLALGRRRALAVKDDLIAGGVAPGRLETVSLGEEDPADPGHTAAAYAANRRVVFVLIRPNE